MKNRTTLWRTVAIIMTIGILLVSGCTCGTETPKTNAPTGESELFRRDKGVTALWGPTLIDHAGPTKQ